MTRFRFKIVVDGARPSGIFLPLKGEGRIVEDDPGTSKCGPQLLTSEFGRS
jgi:hypothetical protein